jgi:hypothetical protein
VEEGRKRQELWEVGIRAPAGERPAVLGYGVAGVCGVKGKSRLCAVGKCRL